MDQAIPPLLGLHAFEASARHGSFAAAAAELYLTPGAISHRVLAAATSGLFGGGGAGRLTVRTQISYAATWLAPRLADFSQHFPQVDLRVLTTVWSDVLPPDDVDLDIRLGNGSWPGFRSTRLHDDEAVVICGPALIAQHGPIEHAADLLLFPRIQVLGFDDLWGRFAALAGRSVPPARAITVDTAITATGIVEHGAFWTIVPERFVRTAVRSAPPAGQRGLSLEPGAAPDRCTGGCVGRSARRRRSGQDAGGAAGECGQRLPTPPASAVCAS